MIYHGAMPRYRLFATDLDGTLFGPDLTISERTRRAFAALHARGTRVVIATGRMFRSTVPFARELNIDTPLITYQGALIRDPNTQEDLWHKVISPDLAREALDALAGAGLHVNFYLNDAMYVKDLTEAAKGYTALARVAHQQVDDWETVLAEGNPTKLVAIGPELEIVAQQERFKAHFANRLFVTQSQPTFLEFADLAAGKGHALRFLANGWGIPPEAVVAVGDGLNDLDMIDYAGLGVAMGSGHPDLIKVANRVTGTLEDDGVAQLIEQMIDAGEI